MIRVHKLKGEETWVNPELVAFIEGGHQSIITLLDGHRIIVSDEPEQIAQAIREHRAKILHLAFCYGDPDAITSANAVGDDARHLHPVPTPEI